MAPSKNKRTLEESPEERRSKRKKPNDEEEDEERDREPVCKGKSSSKKTPAFTGGSSHKPAELFRKDLISAMKLADSEPLSSEDYILIADPWRQEWERGVQVPVNDISLPSVELKEVCEKSKTAGDFKIPKKSLHENKDDTYQLGLHELTGMQQLSEQVVRYDLDDLDVSWLEQINERRVEVGEELIFEWTMERVIEALENQCHENMEIKKKTEEGLGIEYDGDIVCEICHSPDSEDSNEMVFCDGCDICVHQACYGIQTVPEGSWLCRTCALGIKPSCILCPKAGGAMKSTRSGTKWAHVSCAIWIPEVTIGCVDKMEPITKISQIPASRWSLICVICKERCGACIQCSVKACKTAFHVTCAFADKLEMKTVLIEDKNNEDVKLKAYCPKHSKNRDRKSSESETDSPRKSVGGSPVKEHVMSEEERAKLRAQRLHKLEDEFYTLIKISEIAKQLVLTEEIVDLIYVFWKLKRKALHNRPLLTPKTEEEDLLEKQQEDGLVARMKMFVHLRQDLERVRNLSYMIGKREKMKRQFNRSRESVFYAALEFLTDKKQNIPAKEVTKIVKQYRDIPPPYGYIAKKVNISSADTKSDIKKDLDMNSTDIKDIDTLSEVSEDLQSPINAQEDKTSVKDSVKSQSKSKKSITETPKTSRRSRQSDKIDVKDDISKSEVKSETSNVTGDINNSASLDTSEIIDIGIQDDTLVNVSQSSSNDAEDCAKPETESHKKKIGPKSSKAKKLTRNRVSIGKVSEVSSVKTETVKTENDEEDMKVDTTEKVESIKSNRKSRSRSSLAETATSQEISETASSEIVKSDSVERFSPDDFQKDAKRVPINEKPPQRERRQSAAFKLTEEEKQELINSVPSAKNVSDHIKAELNGYLKNNKLVVSNKLRHKVQNSLLKGRRRNRLSNGIIIDHSQKKIDNFFVKSPPQYEQSLTSPVKNMSRILNELSPTRDRMEANNIERTTASRGKLTDFQLNQRSGNTPSRHSPLLLDNQISDREGSPHLRKGQNCYDNSSVTSVREKLFDSDQKRITRQSRETSPESCTSSVKSFGSYKRRLDTDRDRRTRTRSITPQSVINDGDSLDLDSENFCDGTARRRTRSQVVDDTLSLCDGRNSPSCVIHSPARSLLS